MSVTELVLVKPEDRGIDEGKEAVARQDRGIGRQT
jgi:hypothetical protein